MIGVVLVSHSARLAEGLAELAGQMAPGVRIATAGGTDDGGLGTSLELVTAALEQADGGDGVVVLTDLGSATMTAEMALELLDDDRRARTLLVDAPLVEGAVAAAVTAQGGADLPTVVAAARAAADPGGPHETPAAAAAEGAPVGNERLVEVRNPLGFHARPAAIVVRALAGLDARVRVERTDTGASADAASVLGLVGLATKGGTPLRLTAEGADAARALDVLEDLVRGGFDELEQAD